MRIPELVLLCGISGLAFFGLAYLYEDTLIRIEVSCQEGC